MSVPNQDFIKLAARKPWNEQNKFARMHVDALQEAMNNLKGETLKLWLYINKNKDFYEFDLSQKACEAWGLKKDAYYTAKKKLIELGYLVPAKQGSNIYYFYESLSEKPNEDRNSEKPKNSSEKPKNLSEKPKNSSEKPQRNTTNTTNTTIIQQEESSSAIADEASVEVPEVEEVENAPEAEVVTMEEFKSMYADELVFADATLLKSQGIVKIYGKEYKIKQ